MNIRCQLFDKDEFITAVVYVNQHTDLISFNNKLYVLHTCPLADEGYRFVEITPTTDFEVTWIR